uniref:Uncharacterized protein n=1 Tax=Anopheles minimus TaxID=112268 RepID=A0A182VSD3_9DIPT
MYPSNTYAGSTLLSQSQRDAWKSVGKELPTFSGSPHQWWLFISSFEHSTAICGFSDDENLLRLQKALKGDAVEAVISLLLLPSGLKEGMATLKLRFGRPDVIVAVGETAVVNVYRVGSTTTPATQRFIDGIQWVVGRFIGSIQP